MGQEIMCRVDFGKQRSQGKALLETAEVIFRGDFRLKIPFKSISSLKATASKLTIQWPEGSAVFHLGDAAPKWEKKIRNPPSRLDKLGVKAGTKVRLIGRHDGDFRSELAARGALETRANPDLIFLSVAAKEALAEMELHGGAPMWVIYPKGIKTITENDVISAGRAAGLVDVKVCGFSDTHTALKFTARR